MGGEFQADDNPPDSDIICVQNGYVSITPLKLDMTDETFFQK